MKRAYFAVKETISGCVRWVVAGVLSLLVVLPTFTSFGTSS